MPDLYAVIGNPIAQSKSPLIHSEFARASGQDLIYRAVLGSSDGFRAAVDAFRGDGGRGLNVTSPFKLDAFAYATELHERAWQAGAVNCLRCDGDRVEGENFDGVGLLRDLTVNLGTLLMGKRVLVLGAGGAARGALAPLIVEQPAALVVANRSMKNAEALAAAFPGVEPCALSALPRFGSFEIVINATSAGLHGEALNLPASIFADGLAYDMTYGKGLTGFLRSARHAGVTRLHDGVGMLVEQAAEAFTWWRGVRPVTAGIIERLTVPLE